MDGSILGCVTSATLAYAFYATKPRNQGELRETVLQSQQARNERVTAIQDIYAVATAELGSYV